MFLEQSAPITKLNEDLVKDEAYLTSVTANTEVNNSLKYTAQV